MTRLHQTISDAIDLELSEDGAGRDVSTRNLATAIERAILDSTGGPHHIVNVKGYAWTMQHPISERFEGTLFNCPMTTLVAEAPLEQDGRYQVWLDRNALRWEPAPTPG